MRNLLLKILIKLYRKCNREINKLAPDQELSAYRFKNPDDVLKLIKANLTSQTIWAFEAESEKERYRVEGAAIMLQSIKNAHLEAVELYKVFAEDPDKREQHWIRYKKTKGTQIK